MKKLSPATLSLPPDRLAHLNKYKEKDDARILRFWTRITEGQPDLKMDNKTGIKQ